MFNALLNNSYWFNFFFKCAVFPLLTKLSGSSLLSTIYMFLSAYLYKEVITALIPLPYLATWLPVKEQHAIIKWNDFITVGTNGDF